MLFVFRKGKKEARNWHVTFQSNDNVDNTSRICFGMHITDDWVLTRQGCFKAYIPNNSSKVMVKVGRRELRDVVLSVDYMTESKSAEYDLRLVRLSKKRKKHNGVLPCILAHEQYHQLSRVLSEGVFTTKFFKNDSKKWRLLAKRGKIMKTCDNNGDICLRSTSNGDMTNFQGSPLSLRYQGMWYLAGLGVSTNLTNSKVLKFTPLWTVNSWIATTIHEIDTKCTLSSTQEGTKSLCSDLNIEGLVDNLKVTSV